MNSLWLRALEAIIASILARTHENFGPQTLKRYKRLIQTAIEEIASNPELVGSAGRPEIFPHCRSYRLVHRRNKAGGRGNTIRNPRHFVLYRMTEHGAVEIGRVLRDSMELNQHLPNEYRNPAE